MSAFLALLLQNALGAALLAVFALAAGRFVRRPAVRHALWLVVLLRLIIPPAFELRVLPAAWSPAGPDAPSTAPAEPTAAAAAGLRRPEGWARFQRSLGAPAANRLVPLESPQNRLAPPTAATPENRVAPSWIVKAAGLILAGGSLALLVLTGFRIRRFRRLLSVAREAPEALRGRAERLARSLGLGRGPRLRLVPAPISPMLWPRPGGAEILLPETLLERLEEEELDAVLAHELAHARRRDHWVRILELAASVLFWWYPLVWFSRRQLRRHEERSCDTLVARAFPEHRGAYARGLLKTLEWLSRSSLPTPAVATGAGTTRDLEERLTMILQRRAPKLLTTSQRWLLALAAAALLAVVPGWAGSPAEEPIVEEPTAAASVAGSGPELVADTRGEGDSVADRWAIEEGDAEQGESEGWQAELEEEAYHEQVRELDHRMAELEAELHALRAERIALERGLHHGEHERARARAHRHREAHARRMAKEAHQRAIEHELRAHELHERQAIEERHRAVRETLEREISARAEELERRIREGREEEAAELRAELEELVEEQHEHVHELAREAHLLAERRSLRAQRDRLRVRIDRLEASLEGAEGEEVAERIEAEIEALEDLVDELEDVEEDLEDREEEEDHEREDDW